MTRLRKYRVTRTVRQSCEVEAEDRQSAIEEADNGGDWDFCDDDYDVDRIDDESDYQVVTETETYVCDTQEEAKALAYRTLAEYAALYRRDHRKRTVRGPSDTTWQVNSAFCAEHPEMNRRLCVEWQRYATDEALGKNPEDHPDYDDDIPYTQEQQAEAWENLG